MGYFGTYDQAKAAEAIYEASYGTAFVVSETAEYSDAIELGIQLPDTLHEKTKQEITVVQGLSEQELIEDASLEIGLAKQEMEATAWLGKMENALPYLLTLTEGYPSSASAAWGHHWLGRYYQEVSYQERYEREASGAKRSSTAETAAIEASLAKYEKIYQEFPNSAYAEEALYRMASMKNARTKGGVTRDNQERAMASYEFFLEQYPESKWNSRAKMNIAGLKFEMAKSGWYSMQSAYAAMSQIMKASNTLGEFEKGRVQLMMAEIQQYHFKDIQASLDILNTIDTGSGQDSKTASSALYLMANANQSLGNYQQAVEQFGEILQRFDNDACFHEISLHPICLYAMGDCQIALQNWDDAYATFSRLKQDWPNDPRSVNYDKMLAWIEQERSTEDE